MGGAEAVQVQLRQSARIARLREIDAAAAVSPAIVTAAPAKAARTEKPRLICKTEAVTGSLTPKKTCYASDDLRRLAPRSGARVSGLTFVNA